MNLEGDIKPGQDVLVTFLPNWRPRTYRQAKIEKVTKLHVLLDNGTKWNRKGNHPVGSPYGGGMLQDPACSEVQAQRVIAEAEEDQITARSNASTLFDRLYRKGHKAADWKAIVAFLEHQGTPTS